jgi:hypothetical protein
MTAVSALSLALASPTSAQPESRCRVSDVLIAVEYLQSGFSGSTGDRTSIGEDGCFTVDRVVDGKAVERLRSGQLNPDRIASMRAAIETANIGSLPERSGAVPPVNPATLSISYQGVTKTVVAPPGTSIAGMTALGDGFLARLASVLLELTGPG